MFKLWHSTSVVAIITLEILILCFSHNPIPAPPKVTNLKIIGDTREGNKVTVTGTVTGGTEASSRVQWFKSTYSTLEGENGLEALSTSKIAKVGCGICIHIYSCSVFLCITPIKIWLFFRRFAYHWELLAVSLSQNLLL